LAGFGGMGVLPSLGFVLMRLRRARIMADWKRGKVICRLTSGRTFFGLLRYAPGRGKACIL